MGAFRTDGVHFVLVFYEQHLAILHALHLSLNLIKVIDARQGGDIFELILLCHGCWGLRDSRGACGKKWPGLVY